jgi:hypothetical protein
MGICWTKAPHNYLVSQRPYSKKIKVTKCNVYCHFLNNTVLVFHWRVSYHIKFRFSECAFQDPPLRSRTLLSVCLFHDAQCIFLIEQTRGGGAANQPSNSAVWGQLTQQGLSADKFLTLLKYCKYYCTINTALYVYFLSSYWPMTTLFSTTNLSRQVLNSIKRSQILQALLYC